MKYDDLPYSYRRYADSRSWSDEQAAAYWQQGAEVRKYLEEELCSAVQHNISNPHSEIYDRALQLIRKGGARVV